MTVTIYHNPRCSKSRQALALLEQNNVDPVVIKYLENPPDFKTLQSFVRAMGLSSARDMMRTKESIYKDLGLAGISDEAALIKAIQENPILLERPIVVSSKGTAIGRPPENVLTVI